MAWASGYYLADFFLKKNNFFEKNWNFILNIFCADGVKKKTAPGARGCYNGSNFICVCVQWRRECTRREGETGQFRCEIYNLGRADLRLIDARRVASGFPFARSV